MGDGYRLKGHTAAGWMDGPCWGPALGETAAGWMLVRGGPPALRGEDRSPAPSPVSREFVSAGSHPPGSKAYGPSLAEALSGALWLSGARAHPVKCHSAPRALGSGPGCRSPAPEGNRVAALVVTRASDLRLGCRGRALDLEGSTSPSLHGALTQWQACPVHPGLWLATPAVWHRLEPVCWSYQSPQARTGHDRA